MSFFIPLLLYGVVCVGGQCSFVFHYMCLGVVFVSLFCRWKLFSVCFAAVCVFDEYVRFSYGVFNQVVSYPLGVRTRYFPWWNMILLDS